VGANPVRADRAREVPRGGPAPAGAAPRWSLRVAIAEDDPDSLDFFRGCLAGLGHEVVHVAANGTDLLAACRRDPPDLVVADLLLPGLTGVEVAETLSRERPTPFVLLTGHPEVDVLERARAAGVLGFLLKPVTEKDLGPAVALAWDQFGLLRSLRREADELRQSLAERKVIERAKEVVAHRLAVVEGDAFRRMRKYASDRNLKLAEVAQQVLNAEQIFHDLEALH